MIETKNVPTGRVIVKLIDRDQLRIVCLRFIEALLGPRRAILAKNSACLNLLRIVALSCFVLLLLTFTSSQQMKSLNMLWRGVVKRDFSVSIYCVQAMTLDSLFSESLLNVSKMLSVKNVTCEYFSLLAKNKTKLFSPWSPWLPEHGRNWPRQIQIDRY